MTGHPEPPPYKPNLDAIVGIEQGDLSLIGKGTRKLVWWDRHLWWRSYREGGFDGYRTWGGRLLPCDTMEKAVRRPDMADEIRRLSRS